MEKIRKDPRWLHAWYVRHPETWWPDAPRTTRKPDKGSQRDWNYSLGTATFEPLVDFSFSFGGQTGNGSLNVSDQLNGEYLAIAGNLTVDGIYDIGSYPLYPGGPSIALSPDRVPYDNRLFPAYPTTNPSIDVFGLLFRNSGGIEINIWGTGANAYGYDDNGSGSQHTASGSPFTVNIDPGGGQTFPAKFVFDVAAAPSCAKDYTVVGIPANPASGGQANLVGVNNLYSGPGSTGLCPGTGPTVKFAYASGTGQIPANVTLSQDGSHVAFVENLQTGSSYFHVLTLGTTGSNGAGATAAAVPGVGNNAVDTRVLLSPDGGVTNQSSTNSPFIVYTQNDATDVAYLTTYSALAGGSGYLYKLGNVFSGTPAIVWKVAIAAMPSTPVYDSISNKVFFTDSNGRLDYVIDSGTIPSVVYSSVLASGATSENPPVVDSTNQMVYASFNSNGTDATVVQTPTSLAGAVTVPVGAATSTYTGPYSPDFNNAFYTGVGIPLMYVAGTGTGTLPTLYGIGFTSSGQLNPASVTSKALATGMADSSPVTEFYNASLKKDYLFVGVTDNCLATAGGTAGCVLSLDITNGFPTVNAASTALAAPGGTTGIIVDNDSTLNQAASIYYATKSGATLVKATQSGLN